MGRKRKHAKKQGKEALTVQQPEGALAMLQSGYAALKDKGQQAISIVADTYKTYEPAIKAVAYAYSCASFCALAASMLENPDEISASQMIHFCAGVCNHMLPTDSAAFLHELSTVVNNTSTAAWLADLAGPYVEPAVEYVSSFSP